MGIVVFGSVFVDIKGYPTSAYIPSGRNAGRIEQVHGGVSRNIVENIANVELRPTFVGLVDETSAGSDVIDKLKRHKVNTDYIRRCPDGMGTWLAVFDNNGDVAASISKRPDLMPICDILDEYGDEIIKNCDSVAFELDLEKEIVKRIYSLCKKYNKRVYAAVSNMTIASERRDFLKETDCFVCNLEEAGILFMDDFSKKTPQEMAEILHKKISGAGIQKMVVTMDAQGAVYAQMDGAFGVCPARSVMVQDTTGAGDAFFSGVTIGLTYGKTLAEACDIGAVLAASVITSTGNVCPRFMPGEFGIEIEVK